MLAHARLLAILISFAAAKDVTRAGYEGLTSARATQSPAIDATPTGTIWSNPFGPGPEVLPSTPIVASATASSTTVLPTTILSGSAGSSGTSSSPPTTTITFTQVHTNAQGGFSTQANPTRPATPPGRPEQGLPPQMCGSVSVCGTEPSTASSTSGGPTMGVANGGS